MLNLCRTTTREFIICKQFIYQEIEQIELIIDDDDCGKQRRYIYTLIQRPTSIENHIYFCGQANRYKYIYSVRL